MFFGRCRRQEIQISSRNIRDGDSIIILCDEGMLVRAILPLVLLVLSHSHDHWHFHDDNPTHLSPLFRILFLNDFVYLEIRDWKTISSSSWYLASRESIYFDILRLDSKLDRFKLIVKPDLSDLLLLQYIFSKRQDTLVSFWSCYNHKCESKLNTGLKSAHIPGEVYVRDWIASKV